MSNFLITLARSSCARAARATTISHENLADRKVERPPAADESCRSRARRRRRILGRRNAAARRVQFNANKQTLPTRATRTAEPPPPPILCFSSTCAPAARPAPRRVGVRGRLSCGVPQLACCPRATRARSPQFGASATSPPANWTTFELDASENRVAAKSLLSCRSRAAASVVAVAANVALHWRAGRANGPLSLAAPFFGRRRSARPGANLRARVRPERRRLASVAGAGDVCRRAAKQH